MTFASFHPPTQLGRLVLPALVGALLLSGCEEAPDAEAEVEVRTASEVPAALDPPDPIRPEVSGLHGAVVAGHPLAAAAGYEVLRAGGNATDAVVTMAAILAVVRPHMNGVGGDAFALFLDADEEEVRALNGSGRAGRLADPAFFEADGHESMPGSGASAVTVPGAISAWAAAMERAGTLTLAEALAPAIRLAEEGFVVTHTLAEDLEGATRLNDAGQALYAPDGNPLEAGATLRNPALAETLRTLADEGPSAMYGGAIGQALADFIETEGGPLRVEDFADHRADWERPTSMDWLDRRVHTTGPNSQGFVLLQTLGIAEAAGMRDGASLSPDALHTLIEAKKLGFADRDRWLADPAVAPLPMEDLLDPDYLRERAALIDRDRAAEALDPGEEAPWESAAAHGDDEASSGDETSNDGEPLDDGDTVYLMAVDADGNAVSWIQSLFSSFGSGLVEPTTGIVLQNRGAGFTLEEGHPNRVAPGKRPFHTLMATMVTDPDGRFEIAIGTPGGHGQSQTVAQGLLHLLHGGLSPQAAVEAPRYRSEDGTVVLLEDRYPEAGRDFLEARGHELRLRSGWTAPFGNLMVIRREADGTLRTGADMRREGAAMAW